MTTGMELVEPLEPTGEESALARARLHRQLTVEETAKRSGLSVEQVRWLEEGRVYRFARPDDALAATVLYASALGIDNREARELAGLPVPPVPVERNPIARLVAVGATVVALAVCATLLVVPRSGGKHATAVNTAILPAPWRIPVTVLNVLLEGSAKLSELLLQLNRHRLRRDGLADEHAQVPLEAVALATVGALVEVRLRLRSLGVGQHPVHERLHHFFAMRAGIVRGHSTSPPTAWSAMAFFRIRRPRCRRDMTVPIGMSRICAASA